MSAWVAKKALLDVKRECNNRDCRCYSEKGHYIKYANRNVNVVLFVCEECFERKYRSLCTPQDFSISDETSAPRKHVETDHPALRYVIRGFNKTIRAVKYASLCLLIFSAVYIGFFSEKTPLRNADFAIHITETPIERIDTLTQRIQYLLTAERSLS